MQAASGGRRKPKRSRWGPDEEQDTDVPQQSAASVAAQPLLQTVPAASNSQGLPTLADDTLASAPQAGAASAAAAAADAVEVRVNGTASAAAAVEDALQATDLKPPEGELAQGNAEGEMEVEEQQPLDLAQPAERFALPEGVDPLAAVLLRHREDPEGTVATEGSRRTPPSPSASDASEAAEETPAKLDAPVPSSQPQPKAEPGQPSQQSILQSLQPSQSSAPATTSHVQARLVPFLHLVCPDTCSPQNGGL